MVITARKMARFRAWYVPAYRRGRDLSSLPPLRAHENPRQRSVRAYWQWKATRRGWHHGRLEAMRRQNAEVERVWKLAGWSMDGAPVIRAVPKPAARRKNLGGDR